MRLVTQEKKLETRCVQGPNVNGFWDEIEPWVIRGLQSAHGELSSNDVHVLIQNGQMTLFMVHADNELELVCVTELWQYPQYKVLQVVLIAGKNLRDAVRFQPAIEAYAIALGATKIRAWCQEPQLRLYRRLRLGFTKAYNVIEFDLRRKMQ